MTKHLRFRVLLVIYCLYSGLMSGPLRAQQCLTTGYCSTVSHVYPANTLSTTSSTWQTVSAYMNAGNFTYFKVTSGNIYEWSYCEAYGGGSTSWDAQLTLSDSTSGQDLCFSDNSCGTNGKGPYISWTATFTGTVRVLTNVSSCTTNTGSPYDKLVWRMANGVQTTQILGMDVSEYQGTMNWPGVKTDKKLFAWAKSTEGVTVKDNQFVNYMTQGTSAGVVMGAYHFAHPESNTASAEATFFLSVAGPYIKACNLIPALDFETTGSLTGTQLTTWVQTWMTAVKTQTGITPCIYTTGSIANMLSSSVKTYPLWMADPDSSSTAPPASLGGWSTWTFKQYSWTGTVWGTSPVDLDVFNGDMNAFNALIGCTTGITEKAEDNNQINLYPNPANDHIVIENTSFNNNGREEISIYNMQGQLLLHQPVWEANTEIEISNFKPGLYIVRVETGDGAQVKKFIKAAY